MFEFFRCDIEVAKQRVKRRAIISLIITIVLMVLMISQGTWEWEYIFLLFGMIGGIGYGKNIIANIGRSPVDEDGYPFEYGGISGMALRLGLAVAIGATIGIVLFGWDLLRLIFVAVKSRKKTEEIN